MKIKQVGNVKNILGEGPVWSVLEQCLYWVDILNPAIFRWSPSTGEQKSWKLNSHLGSFALTGQNGGAIVATKEGIGHFNFEKSELRIIHRPEIELKETRFNDGKCDMAGRFWAGTMDYKEYRDIGNLYRVDLDGSMKKMKSGVIISNGLGWSPDNCTMYYTDSPRQKIFAYDFELRTGEMKNERVFVEIEEGYPDGLTVDSEGCIWSAIWDGWRINKYSHSGKLLDQIKLPISRPTSCCFGGPELNQLYVTSARKGLSPDELGKQPEAGAIFEIDSGSKGLPMPHFKGRLI